jgi:hypothetical protein
VATYTVNISNSVRVFGEGPSTKWGQASFPATMVWGVSSWGEGRPMLISFSKVIAESVALDWVKTNSTYQRISAGTFVVQSDMGSETLMNGIWSYVFTSDTTDGEDRAIASWTTAPGVATSYTCLSVSGISWSEV